MYAPELGVVFSGDTLFSGGPGATGRSFSDYPTIIESIKRLFAELPADTVVHTGHGDSTTLGRRAAEPAGVARPRSLNSHGSRAKGWVRCISGNVFLPGGGNGG